MEHFTIGATLQFTAEERAQLDHLSWMLSQQARTAYGPWQFEYVRTLTSINRIVWKATNRAHGIDN